MAIHQDINHNNHDHHIDGYCRPDFEHIQHSHIGDIHCNPDFEHKHHDHNDYRCNPSILDFRQLMRFIGKVSSLPDLNQSQGFPKYDELGGKLAQYGDIVSLDKQFYVIGYGDTPRTLVWLKINEALYDQLNDLVLKYEALEIELSNVYRKSETSSSIEIANELKQLSEDFFKKTDLSAFITRPELLPILNEIDSELTKHDQAINELKCKSCGHSNAIEYLNRRSFELTLSAENSMSKDDLVNYLFLSSYTTIYDVKDIIESYDYALSTDVEQQLAGLNDRFQEKGEYLSAGDIYLKSETSSSIQLNAAFESLISRMNIWDSHIFRNRTDIEDLSSKLMSADHTFEIRQIEELLKDIDNNIVYISSDMAYLFDEIKDELKKYILSSDLSALTNDVERKLHCLKKVIAGITVDMEAMKADIAYLKKSKSDISTLKNDVSVIVNEVKTISLNYITKEQLTGNVLSNYATVSSLDNYAPIEALGNFATNDELDDIKKTINKHSEAISKGIERDAELLKMIKELSGNNENPDIVITKQQVNDIFNKLNAYDNEISLHDSRITTLENEVNTLKNIILNNLANVGEDTEINTVYAALINIKNDLS